MKGWAEKAEEWRCKSIGGMRDYWRFVRVHPLIFAPSIDITLRPLCCSTTPARTLNMAIKITVKWNKETYDIDLETQGGLDLLQAKLLSLTSVPIERQKLTCKGKFVRDDAAVQTLQEGAKLILIGSADSAPAKPTTKVVFEEDLSDREKVSQTRAAIQAPSIAQQSSQSFTILQCSNDMTLRRATRQRPVAMATLL